MVEGVAGGFPENWADHGVSWLLSVCGPQVGGLLRAALGPTSRSIRKLVKGACGRPWGSSPRSGSTFAGSSKTAVTWPVLGWAITLPTSRTDTP